MYRIMNKDTGQYLQQVGGVRNPYWGGNPYFIWTKTGYFYRKSESAKRNAEYLLEQNIPIQIIHYPESIGFSVPITIKELS